ncbi:MAG: carbon-nitrogen hydrolase family protein [Cyclobacteriaceae bacterium]
MSNTAKIGIVQKGAEHLDLNKSLPLMLSLIEEAGSQGTNLLVFGETWLTGYPAWLDYCPGVALWGNPATKEVFARMHRNSISIPGPETEAIGELAKKHSMVIVAGANEKVLKGKFGGTLFNTLLIFDEEGNIANHHRKLMPTYTEKLLYGTGDGKGLAAVETSFGRIGGLICWEHWMSMTRQAMHDENEHIHIALWPKVHEMHQIASRQYAFEGRCFVIAAGQIMRTRNIPEALDVKPEWQNNPDHLLLNGGSCLIGPDGHYLLSPVFDKEEILYTSIPDTDEVMKERMTLDVSGHYQRPDVFSYSVNKNRYE